MGGDLVHCALSFFCTEREPDMPGPPREECEPFVEQIIENVMRTLDENEDGVISREEFELFGTYLNAEYRRLQKYLANKNKEKTKVSKQVPNLPKEFEKSLQFDYENWSWN